MNGFDLVATAIGDGLPRLQIEPLTRHDLALYCGGSGDHVAVHTDIDVARQSGLDDVIGHGMLTMAWLGRLLTGIAAPDHLRQFQTRFVTPTSIGDRITCSGTVSARASDGDETLVTVRLEARRADGMLVAEGWAVLSVSP